MSIYKEYKIRLVSGSTWISSASYEIIERERNSGKGGASVRETQIFKGNILDCESYLRLLESGVVEL